MNKEDIKRRLMTDDALFNFIYTFQQSFDVSPKNEHYGAYIDYQDIYELREDFLDALIDTIVDWVYSQEKYYKLLEIEKKNGKTDSAAASAVQRKVKAKFRGAGSEKLLSQGQFGELLLFHFIQHCFHAVPVLRKMPITTSSQQERFGADAIHYKIENDKNIFILGEAKAYTTGTFNAAFKKAIGSITTTVENLRSELRLYVHEDFLDEEMNEVAEKFLNNTLKNYETHLVCIIAYNETKEITKLNELEIRKQIKKVIEERYSKTDKGLVDLDKYPILTRMTYIVFPIWKLDEMVESFQKML